MIPEGEEEKFNALPEEYSHLYLCIVGRLAAEICIADPLRKEAKAAIEALHACGISKVVMMTGDNRKTAQAVAREVGVDQFYADVLPEDKASFIRQEKSAGRKVIMIGDGVNDTPALSEADVGIAINTGAAIAREIADVTIASEDLFELVTLRKISQALMNHSSELPVHRRLQLHAHRFGRGGRHSAHHLRPAAQRVHAGHQSGQHDGSLGQGERVQRAGSINSRSGLSVKLVACISPERG